MLLYEEGFIDSYKDYTCNNKQVCVYLKYDSNNDGFLNLLKVISKPSKSVYLNYNSICNLSVKKNFFVISTTLGLKTSCFCKEKKLGGQLLFIC